MGYLPLSHAQARNQSHSLKCSLISPKEDAEDVTQKRMMMMMMIDPQINLDTVERMTAAGIPATLQGTSHGPSHVSWNQRTHC